MISIITLHCNQSGVLILTDIINQIYMLHVKFQYVFTILQRYIIKSQYVASWLALQVLRIQGLTQLDPQTMYNAVYIGMFKLHLLQFYLIAFFYDSPCSFQT